MPSLDNSGSVAAQNTIDQEKATVEMLFRALDLKSATDLSAFARNGVTGKENAQINGKILDSQLDAAETDNAKVREVQKDFSDSFSAINQLPCSEINDTDLSRKTFVPGVYCLSSAKLAGELILSGENDPNAIFVFRIAGAFQTIKNSTVSLINKAQVGSVFFLTDDNAIIGEDADFNGNILARGDIIASAGAKIAGRTLSLEGKIELNGGTLGLQQTGVLEICKAIDATLGSGLENRIFRFRIGSLITEIAAGQCSGSLTVPTGPIVIEELLNGRTTDDNTISGNFQLTRVRVLGYTPETALTSTNLPQRIANVVITEGNNTNPTRIEFTNRFAFTGVVEICKEGLDSGVTGFFNFTIDVLTDRIGQPIPFSVPVGQCTGPITVLSPTATVVAREMPRTGFIFTRAVTNSPDRLINVHTLNRAVTARIVEGGESNETKIFFYNRTAPAELKICKIAGPGIPEMTPFNFSVAGRIPLEPGADGVVPVGSQPSGLISVTVPAGSVASGGFCQTVNAPGTTDSIKFVVDTTVTVTETTGDQIPGIPGQIILSRIKSTTGIVKATATQNTLPSGQPARISTLRPALTFIRNPGMALYPASGTVNGRERSVTVPVGRQLTEVEFVNTAFVPVPLKICKVAANASLIGQPFTFTVTTDTVGGLLAPSSATVTILAGPPAVNPGDFNGNCDFVSGPFRIALINGLGTFNLNSRVTVSELPSTLASVSAIVSPTSNIIVNLGTRSAVITSMINGVNELQFINKLPSIIIIDPRPCLFLVKCRRR